MERARVGLIGLGFGSEFIPIYQAHPRAEVAAICQRTKGRLDEVGDRFGIATRYTDFREVLTDPNVDFVHINSPIPDHAPQTIAALKAGKHVMCTVPMATTLDECRQIVRLVRETGLKYMMAETVVYSREFLFIKELYDKGELGKIQYMQASHPQDMDGWPDYWEDMMPMHYATHVVSPLMAWSTAGRSMSVLRLGDDQRRVRAPSPVRSSPSSPVTSRSRTQILRRTSGASFAIPLDSIARASTFTVRRSRSNGSSSTTKIPCSTPPRSRSRR